jgi:hypothetical protein
MGMWLRWKNHNRRTDLDLWSGRACVGGSRPLRRDGVWRGAADERDRRAHGTGSESRNGDANGVAGCLLASGYWRRAGDSRSHRCRVGHCEPTLWSTPVEPGNVGVCRTAARIDSTCGGRDPRSARGCGRSHAGLAYGIKRLARPPNQGTDGCPILLAFCEGIRLTALSMPLHRP